MNLERVYKFLNSYAKRSAPPSCYLPPRHPVVILCNTYNPPHLSPASTVHLADLLAVFTIYTAISRNLHASALSFYSNQCLG